MTTTDHATTDRPTDHTTTTGDTMTTTDTTTDGADHAAILAAQYAAAMTTAPADARPGDSMTTLWARRRADARRADRRADAAARDALAAMRDHAAAIAWHACDVCGADYCDDVTDDDAARLCAVCGHDDDGAARVGVVGAMFAAVVLALALAACVVPAAVAPTPPVLDGAAYAAAWHACAADYYAAPHGATPTEMAAECDAVAAQYGRPPTDAPTMLAPTPPTDGAPWYCDDADAGASACAIVGATMTPDGAAIVTDADGRAVVLAATYAATTPVGIVPDDARDAAPCRGVVTLTGVSVGASAPAAVVAHLTAAAVMAHDADGAPCRAAVVVTY